jgi:cyclic-di-GMP phosphodiesterase TipF (flagellum assembly factor)
MRLPEFPSIDLPTDPGPSLPLPPRVSLVASAVENDASEAYLSPIVTLSENAVSHYELAVELVSASGERLDAGEEDFVLAGGELAQRFDIARLTRAAALAQRMEAREKGGVLLTEFMGSSLTSRAFLETFASVYEARRAIAGQFVLTFRQRAVDELPQAAWQALRDMHEFGFRFALDRVEHMGSDFALLARSGFKFVRLDSGALLEGFMARDRFVEAQEVHQRLTLAGLIAIASGIAEVTVQQRLLASGVTLGQGPLFGEPRRLSLNGPTTGAHSAAA